MTTLNLGKVGEGREGSREGSREEEEEEGEEEEEEEGEEEEEEEEEEEDVEDVSIAERRTSNRDDEGCASTTRVLPSRARWWYR
jgi:hypothetical protein